MAKAISKKIEAIELIKVEKRFNSDVKMKYFYNIKFEKIDELLVLETDEADLHDLVGKKIEYKINDEGLISEFDIS